jgi:plasmid segregation protein ParM
LTWSNTKITLFTEKENKETMRTFGMGHDHGNSRTTDIVYLNGKEEMRTFPSMSCDGSLKYLANIRRAEGNEAMPVDSQVLRAGEYVLSLDGAERFVGKLAITQGLSAASSGIDSIHRYWSRRSLETLLVSAADIIPDTEFELLVVTGLPVATFNDENRKRVKAALNGSHHFTFNGRDRVAIVKVGKVIMEAAGASILRNFKDDDKTYGFIDIGGRTTDLYVRKGLQAVALQCRGFDLGVETAAQKVNDWFADTYGFPLSEQNKIGILMAYATGSKYPDITADGISIPELELTRRTKKAFSDAGKDIVEKIATYWRTNETGKVAADFAGIEVVGGGAYYFLSAIQTLLPRAVKQEQPEHANGRGYGWFASELVRQRAEMAS